MSYTSIGKICGIGLFAGLVTFIPLHIMAGNGKEANNSGIPRTLEAKVREALREHTYVEFEVAGRDVILRGYVHTRNEKNIVESQIRGVSGVTHIRDEIEIGQSAIEAIEERAENTAITTAVNAGILANKELNSLGIHVQTEQGVVTLSGTVQKAGQIKFAEKVARGTKGVKEVVNKLSIAS